MQRRTAHRPRVIPVLDLKGGRAVRAVAGDRACYGPLASCLHADPADLVGLARAGRDRLGAAELYLADLDAITGAPPARELYARMVRLGIRLWVDAGVRDPGDVDPLIEAGVATVVLGLETLRGPEALAGIVARHGTEGLALSLDLRAGRPLVARGAAWGTSKPQRLAGMAVEAGLGRLIVLDLARVGTGRGVGTLPLLAALRAAYPAIDLVAGGGVAGVNDLNDLGTAGASGVLVGSALHDGRLGAEVVGGR